MVRPDDVFEPEAPPVVITVKLNVAYHISDIPANIGLDEESAPLTVHVDNSGESITWQERVFKELVAESAYLDKLIKNTQTRKNIIDVLIGELRKHRTLENI